MPDAAIWSAAMLVALVLVLGCAMFVWWRERHPTPAEQRLEAQARKIETLSEGLEHYRQTQLTEIGYRVKLEGQVAQLGEKVGHLELGNIRPVRR